MSKIKFKKLVSIFNENVSHALRFKYYHKLS